MYEGRVVVGKLLEAGKSMIGKEVVVGGWVKTGRKQGKDTFAFLEVNDGSSRENVQLMVTAETYDITKLVVSGTVRLSVPADRLADLCMKDLTCRPQCRLRCVSIDRRIVY
jgi:aspartyl/asparaginyl-tRNA synthetase